MYRKSQPTTKLLEPIFSKVTEHKINTQKKSITLYPGNAQRHSNFKIPFIIAPQNEI